MTDAEPALVQAARALRDESDALLLWAGEVFQTYAYAGRAPAETVERSIAETLRDTAATLARVREVLEARVVAAVSKYEDVVARHARAKE